MIFQCNMANLLVEMVDSIRIAEMAIEMIPSEMTIEVIVVLEASVAEGAKGMTPMTSVVYITRSSMLS